MGFTGTSAEFDQIRFYGTERLEDAAVAAGIGRLMARAGRMPRQAWGELPWSTQWAQDWTTSCAWRRQDAKTAHDYQVDTANRVLQALADYTRTDVNVATTFELAAKGLTAYMRPEEATDRTLGIYRPGGGYRYVDTPPDGMYGPFLEPRGNPELDGIYDDHCPTETDTLFEFMADYGDVLRQVDDAIASWGLGLDVRLYYDYLAPAVTAQPRVIDQFAEEVLKGANGWAEIAQNLKNDTSRLRDAWHGTAGTAAGEHGRILADYLDRCQTEALWLGRSGKQCAVTLRNIKNGFAKIGYARIGQIIELYQEFNNWISSASNLVFHLTGGKFAEAGQDLVDTVKDTANAMGEVIKSQADTAGAVLQVETTANGMPDLGTVEHEHQPPARNDAPGADAWAHATTW
jgi:hypothetical protein